MCDKNVDNRTSWDLVVSSISGTTEKIFYSVKEYTVETVEHLALLCLLYIFLCLMMYYSVMKWKILPFQRGIMNPKRVLLVTAHPDDECMFFGPTVVNLIQNNGCTVFLLCLSTGVNYGMGKVRKNELYKSCEVLGIEEGRIIIQNHTLLPDSMEEKWPIELVSQMILRQIESLSINTVITFDKHGVSKHLNHCSIYYAIASLCIDKELPDDCKVFVLESTNIVRKYWYFLDLPLSFAMSSVRYIVNETQKGVVRDAMKAHKSQYVWFRKLFLKFSRFSFINTLEEMDVLDIELDLEVDDDM